MNEKPELGLKTRPPGELTLKVAVPRGPYAGRNRLYEALLKLEAVERERAIRGFNPFDSEDLAEWMGITRADVVSEVERGDYLSFKVARAKGKISGALSDCAEDISNMIRQYAEDATRMEPKERKEALNTIANMADKYGLTDADLSKGDIVEGENTEQDLQRTALLFKNFLKTDVAIQRLLKEILTEDVDTNTAPNTGGKDSTGRTDDADKADKNSKPKRPNKVVDTVQVSGGVAKE